MRPVGVLLVLFIASTVAVRSSGSSSIVRAPKSAIARAVASRPPTIRQHEGHASGAPPAVFALAIDGSSDPSAVSDERAYDQVISLVASAQSERIRNVVFDGAGLNAADRAAFWAAVAVVKNERDLLADRHKSRRINSAEFVSQQRIVFDNARGRVARSLSSGGLARLDEYVRTQVKPRIKVYRAPMLSQNEVAQ